MKKSQNIFFEKVANKVSRSGNWGFIVQEIPLPLLIKQVFTETQTSGMCWNL